METMVDLDVVLVHWPAEDDRRRELQELGRPRLLLIEGGAPAPASTEPDEDWIRMPAADADVQARVDGLARRLGRSIGPAPELDEDGLLHVGGEWVSLPPVEARLAAALLDRYRLVVSRDALARAGWPKGAPGRNALDVHVLRLRRRIAPLGLAIRTVRSRGYLLEPGR